MGPAEKYPITFTRFYCIFDPTVLVLNPLILQFQLSHTSMLPFIISTHSGLLLSAKKTQNLTPCTDVRLIHKNSLVFGRSELNIKRNKGYFIFCFFNVFLLWCEARKASWVNKAETWIMGKCLRGKNWVNLTGIICPKANTLTSFNKLWLWWEELWSLD